MNTVALMDAILHEEILIFCMKSWNGNVDETGRLGDGSLARREPDFSIHPFFLIDFPH